MKLEEGYAPAIAVLGEKLPGADIMREISYYILADGSEEAALRFIGFLESSGWDSDVDFYVRNINSGRAFMWEMSDPEPLQKWRAFGDFVPYEEADHAPKTREELKATIEFNRMMTVRCTDPKGDDPKFVEYAKTLLKPGEELGLKSEKGVSGV